MIRTGSFTCIALLLALAPRPASRDNARPVSLEGRWVLVEQSYGKGKSDLAGVDKPIHLEFSRQGVGMTARALSEEDPGRSWDWPVVVADGEPLPIQLIHRAIHAESGIAEARYRLRPSRGDDLILEVVESYRLVEDGEALVGTVRIRFLLPPTGAEEKGFRERGVYELTRRFERVP